MLAVVLTTEHALRIRSGASDERTEPEAESKAVVSQRAILKVHLHVCAGPNFIELLLKVQKVAKHKQNNAYQSKVTGKTTMSQVQYVTCTLLMSA